MTASTRFSNGFSDSNVDPEYCNLVALTTIMCYKNKIKNSGE